MARGAAQEHVVGERNQRRALPAERHVRRAKIGDDNAADARRNNRRLPDLHRAAPFDPIERKRRRLGCPR